MRARDRHEQLLLVKIAGGGGGGITPTGTLDIAISENGLNTRDVTQYAQVEITTDVADKFIDSAYKVVESYSAITLSTLAVLIGDTKTISVKKAYDVASGDRVAVYFHSGSMTFAILGLVTGVTSSTNYNRVTLTVEDIVTNFQYQQQKTITSNGTYKVIGYAVAKVDVPQPSGTVQISQNGTVNVKNYEYADVDVPEPSGTIQISKNGTVDVKNYEFAEVDVPTSGGDIPAGYTEVDYEDFSLSKFTIGDQCVLVADQTVSVTAGEQVVFVKESGDTRQTLRGRIISVKEDPDDSSMQDITIDVEDMTSNYAGEEGDYIDKDGKYNVAGLYEIEVATGGGGGGGGTGWSNTDALLVYGGQNGLTQAQYNALSEMGSGSLAYISPSQFDGAMIKKGTVNGFVVPDAISIPVNKAMGFSNLTTMLFQDAGAVSVPIDATINGPLVSGSAVPALYLRGTPVGSPNYEMNAFQQVNGLQTIYCEFSQSDLDISSELWFQQIPNYSNINIVYDAVFDDSQSGRVITS